MQEATLYPHLRIGILKVSISKYYFRVYNQKVINLKL